MLCYAMPLINLNLILTNYGSTKILCMIIKLKFTKPEAKVYITGISYTELQYFVSFVFVTRA